MREWNLRSGDPLCLTLASDARLGPTDYLDDQIWELSLGGGDPPALALQTTYGLRAKAARFIPRFKEGDLVVTDPATFALPPRVKLVFPNFACIAFSPIPDIDVIAEYWVPESHAVAGRLQISNRGDRDRQIQVEWLGQLTANQGMRMAPMEMQAANVLWGSTGGLTPVIFMTGGPKPGPGSYPSLMLSLDLPRDGQRQFTWAHAALAEREASFALARKLAAYNWDAERARLEMLNAGQVDVHTGEADWDAAFMLAQKAALSLWVGPTPNLPHPSFVLTRQPDQGYSLRGDGSDYNHLWSGQTPLEAFYLAGLVLPAAPTLVQGLLRNYLAVQEENGFIDWKPGLSGQRSRLIATPLLASLAWRIFEMTEETAFLEEIFPVLLKFLQAWFTPEHDRDQDGVPEWDHLHQSGSEDHPVYSNWHDWAEGVDISTAESVGLCAFLYRECQVLQRMAKILGHDEHLPSLQTLSERLKTAVEAAWDAQEASYFDWDRDTHISSRREWIGQRLGTGSLFINRTFEHPIRLLAHIRSGDTSRRRLHIFVHGMGASGNPRVERVNPEQFKWSPGLGRLTGRYVYQALERIEVYGLEADDQVTFYTANYDCQDHSLLTPLWAGIPEAQRAAEVVDGALTDTARFWQPYGLPACARPPQLEEEASCGAINLPWNTLIGEGLIHYGYRDLAAELVKRLMSVVIQNLKREGAFRRYYHATTGQGIGERNALNGLAPLGLFLETLGVRLISSSRVAISGVNPFPWPVTVKFRGLTILRQKEKTVVIFPDGQTAEIDDPQPRIVSLQVQNDPSRP